MSDEPQEFDELVGSLVSEQIEPMSSLSVMVDFNDLHTRHGEDAFEIVRRLRQLLS